MSDTFASLASRIMGGGSIKIPVPSPPQLVPRSVPATTAQHGTPPVLVHPASPSARLSQDAASPTASIVPSPQKPIEQQQQHHLARGPSLRGTPEQLVEARQFRSSVTQGRSGARARATNRSSSATSSHSSSVRRPSYVYGENSPPPALLHTDLPIHRAVPTSTLGTVPGTAGSEALQSRPTPSAGFVVPAPASQQQQQGISSSAGLNGNTVSAASAPKTETTPSAGLTPPHLRQKYAALSKSKEIVSSHAPPHQKLHVAEEEEVNEQHKTLQPIDLPGFEKEHKTPNLFVHPTESDKAQAHAQPAPTAASQPPNINIKKEPVTPEEHSLKASEPISFTSCSALSLTSECSAPKVSEDHFDELTHVKAERVASKASETKLASQVIQLTSQVAQLESQIPSIKAMVVELEAKVDKERRENFELLSKVEILTQTSEQRRYLGTMNAKAPFEVSVKRPDGKHERVQVSAVMKISDLIRRARVAHKIGPYDSINPRIVVNGNEIGHGMTLHEAGISEATSVEFLYDGSDEIDEEL